MTTETINLDIGGMTCQACANRIEKVLNKKPAILEATVNYANETAHVSFDDSQTNADEVLDWVKKTGYTAHIQQADAMFSQDKATESVTPPLRLILIWLCLLPFLWGMLGMMIGKHDFMPAIWVQFILATIVQFGLALPFYKSAWASIRGGLANMDVLVVLGTLTIWAYSTYVWLTMESSHAMHDTAHAMPDVYFEAGVMVIAFVRLGKYLEERTKKHSLNSINLLLELTPSNVLLKVGNDWQQTPLSKVKIGQILLAKHGDRIACDGVVTAVTGGEAWCDESHLTGESLPIPKKNADNVMAGAMLSSGTLEYRATAIGSQTQLGDMITALNDAQGSKANIARIADRVAGVFVPVVVVIAILTFIGNFYVLGSFDTALMRAVAVLVIACPCAMGLATPSAIMAGMGVASRHGVWFKDAQALEATGSVDTIALDKTGTITEGKPQVVAHYLFDEELNLAEIAQITATLETHANHPLATAMLDYAKTFNLENTFTVNNVENVTGKGIQGDIADIGLVKVGSPAFTNMTLPQEILAEKTWQVASLVAVSVNDVPIAMFALADSLKADSMTAIASLKKLGLTTIMLSGDKQSVADYIGGQVKIDTAIGELSPRDKATKISELQQNGKKVAMVGDGVNDAPAMATATASFAVQNGTDIAQHSASARLMGDGSHSISHVLSAVTIARATLRNIKQNLFFAFIYNMIGIGFAMVGLLNPMLAAGAMALSSISVLMNALRLTRLKG